jgi:acetolactate synthase-1/2/3 large subunit
MLALRGSGLQSVVTAREDAAVIMAGIAGRLAGAPGLAFTTKGPGLASATNGLASALLDRLPVLTATEGFDAGELRYLSHQVFDQAAVYGTLFAGVVNGKAPVLECEAPDVAAALDAMLRPPMGPALLLADPLTLTAPLPSDKVPTAGRSPEIDAEDLDRAATLLASARRPVIVAGLEAANSSASAGVRALAQALGAPVLVTYMGKGIIADDDPLFAGIFTGGAIEQPCVAASDLIILAGLDPVELIRKPWPYEAPVLDLCGHVHAPHYVTPAARVTGDVAAATERLAAVARAGDWGEAELSAHRARFLSGMTMTETDGLSAGDVVSTAVDAFDARPRLTVDAGAHMFSACAFWPCRDPLDLLISNGLASMGFAVPAALAAALHEPDRGALAMTGDGGLLMCLGELNTAGAVGANLAVIVFNDATLSLIDIKRQQRQMPDLGMSWPAPDFAAIAEGFGFRTWTARDAATLRASCRAAAEATGPRLIDARVDPAGYPAQLRALRG